MHVEKIRHSFYQVMTGEEFFKEKTWHITILRESPPSAPAFDYGMSESEKFIYCAEALKYFCSFS